MSGGNERSNEDWLDRWTSGKTGWHVSEGNKLFMDHLDLLIKGRKNITIVFPLCGKAMEMKSLADMGHQVIGIDLSPLAASEFFKEHNIEYTSTAIGSIQGTLFQNNDGSIKIYACDFFDINSNVIGKVDGIWDRMSLSAINLQDRPRYAEVMKDLMSIHCCYLLSAVRYDNLVYQGPPRVLTDEEIEGLFGTKCNFKEIAHAQSPNRPPKFEEHGIYIYEHLYLLTLKQ